MQEGSYCACYSVSGITTRARRSPHVVKLSYGDRITLVAMLQGHPLMHREGDRSILLGMSALAAHAPLIDLTGAAADAASRIVTYLEGLGRPSPAAHPLGLLLNTMKDRLPYDQQGTIEGLLTSYQLLVPVAPLDEPANGRGQAPAAASDARPRPGSPPSSAHPFGQEPGRPPGGSALVGRAGDGWCRDPEKFLDLDDQERLIELLQRLFRRGQYRTAKGRDQLFARAGVHQELRLAMREQNANPELYLTRYLAGAQWSLERADYHPLPTLLGALLSHPHPVDLSTQDRDLCEYLLAQARLRLLALRTRAALARVAADSGETLAAGVLIAPWHVLTTGAGAEASRARPVWLPVRANPLLAPGLPGLLVRRAGPGGPAVALLPACPEARLVELERTAHRGPPGHDRVSGSLDLSALAAGPPSPGEPLYLWTYGSHEATLLLAEAQDAREGGGLSYTLEAGALALTGSPIFNPRWQLAGLHLVGQGPDARGVDLSAARPGLAVNRLE